MDTGGWWRLRTAYRHSLLRFLVPGRGLGLCFNDVRLGFKSKVFSAQAPTVLTTSLATL